MGDDADLIVGRYEGHARAWVRNRGIRLPIMAGQRERSAAAASDRSDSLTFHRTGKAEMHSWRKSRANEVA
jgi:hypothetical protein